MPKERTQLMSLTHTTFAPHMQPFTEFIALDGCHCITSSLARIFHWAGHPLSEEMLLGLGAGMGFVYWRMKFGNSESVFVGGRSNLKTFYQDLGKRTGVAIRELQTSSESKAETELLRSLKERKPVMLGGDMGMLPWFSFPVEYHFGGHTFIACGYDGNDTILCSDIDQKGTGLKKGFVAPISREQLRKARSSPFKPFPPKNLWLEFDFSAFRKPTSEEVVTAIRQMIDGALNPPIKNFGVRGMRHTADELLKWPTQFSDSELRSSLFNLYIFIEVGGTGGGCFRPMYARFLGECAHLTGIRALLKSAEDFEHIGHKFTEIGLLFKNAMKVKDLQPRIKTASNEFRQLAEMEEQACRHLASCLNAPPEK
jgi:hypothetical protein